ncbi:sulfite exporter TauE/SafE family protein [Piscinibacter sakaiensis]|uniref:Probable membrane transporter protein n=1 Tax=Piscinibacter sakaiensis TaxID=1547922 RepID=A0A0K8P062_PISS1|nr:sulfite exporter TauE/SafE family protein [Piscinibacter sakaiensis]GAP36018.1 putative membrane protein [Piscinibacter sakaiensis]
MDLWQLGAVTAVFALAGGVKGVTGMGLPTVAMSLLGLWMPPLQAAALLVVPSLATNLAQCRGAHLRRLARRLWPGWMAIVVVTIAAPGWDGPASAESAKPWLGLILIAYGLWGLGRPTLPDLSGRGRWLGAVAGAATGLVTASTAIFVLPWVPYLQSLRLARDEMVQALGLSFTVATLALAVRVQASEPLSGLSAAGAAAVGLALAGAFAGMASGEALRGRLSGPAFQKALFLVFVALGVANLARGG